MTTPPYPKASLYETEALRLANERAIRWMVRTAKAREHSQDLTQRLQLLDDALKAFSSSMPCYVSDSEVMVDVSRDAMQSDIRMLRDLISGIARPDSNAGRPTRDSR